MEIKVLRSPRLNPALLSGTDDTERVPRQLKETQSYSATRSGSSDCVTSASPSTQASVAETSREPLHLVIHFHHGQGYNYW